MKSVYRCLELAVASIVVSTAAWGTGYDKAIPPSGRHAGYGAAAAAVVSDAEALYFNPAGLAGLGSGSRNLTLNLSLLRARASAPVTAPNTTLDSKAVVSPPFGVMVAASPAKGLGIGAGLYLAGGSKVEYEAVDYSTIQPYFDALKPTVASSLTILEASLGAGYQPIEGLRLGAAWRVLMVSGAVSSAGAVPSASPLVLTAVDIADVRSTNYGGVRLGLQYGPRDSGWGVGASWRSAVRFAAEGTASGKYENGAGVADLDKAGAATVTNTFPQQLSTGGYVDLLGRQLRVLGEYNWTQYSVNQTLEIDGTLALPAGVLGPSAIPVLADLQQSWKDQHNYRVGAEYAGISGWAIRAGYVATRSVVPIDHASATSSIPEVNHTVTMGAGTKLLGTKLNLSGALEYSFASAEVPSNSVRGFRGEYSATAYAAYFGVSYDL